MADEGETNEQNIREIKTQLARLEDKVDNIIELLDGSLKNNCEKMGEHIDFVEQVYSNVKYPLEYMCNKVRAIAGVTPKPLCPNEPICLVKNAR
jgi:hypothetical protein